MKAEIGSLVVEVTFERDSGRLLRSALGNGGDEFARLFAASSRAWQRENPAHVPVVARYGGTTRAPALGRSLGEGFTDTRRAHDIAESLGLPADDYACTDCDWKTWKGAELDEDGRCWACAARIRNEKRRTT